MALGIVATLQIKPDQIRHFETHFLKLAEVVLTEEPGCAGPARMSPHRILLQHIPGAATPMATRLVRKVAAGYVVS